MNYINQDYKHGQSFTARIGGTYCEGKISIDDTEEIYLCQNTAEGHRCKHTFGYKYAWWVGKGSADELNRYNVTDLIGEQDFQKEKQHDYIHGQRFEAEMSNEFFEGKVNIQDGVVYLCQDKHDASYKPTDTLGYKYAWSVRNSYGCSLEIDDITNLKLFPLEEAEQSSNEFRIGQRVKAKYAGKAARDGLRFDRLMNQGETGIITAIEEDKNYFYIEIRLDKDCMFTIRAEIKASRAPIYLKIIEETIQYQGDPGLTNILDIKDSNANSLSLFTDMAIKDDGSINSLTKNNNNGKTIKIPKIVAKVVRGERPRGKATTGRISRTAIGSGYNCYQARAIKC